MMKSSYFILFTLLFAGQLTSLLFSEKTLLHSTVVPFAFLATTVFSSEIASLSERYFDISSFDLVKLYSSQFDEAHKFRKYSSAVGDLMVSFEFVEGFVVVVMVVTSLFIVEEL